MTACYHAAVSERALIRRNFREAYQTSQAGIKALIQTHQESSSSLRRQVDGEAKSGEKELPISLRPSSAEGNLTNECCRLIVVFLQASAELHLQSAPPSQRNRAVIINNTDSAKPTVDEYAGSRSLEEVIRAQSLLEVFRFCDNAIPYPASLVWLNYLSSLGHREKAKELVLAFLQSYEGRLYSQGHWRAIAAGCGENVDDDKIIDKSLSRYEHLIEMLVVDIFVPLNDISTALSFLSQRTNGLSEVCRNSLRYTVLQANSTKEDDSPAPVADSDAGIKYNTNSNFKNHSRSLNSGKTNQRSESSAAHTISDQVFGEDDGLTREDIEMLALGAASLITTVAGIFVAWRRRQSIMSGLKRLGTYFR